MGRAWLGYPTAPNAALAAAPGSRNVADAGGQRLQPMRHSVRLHRMYPYIIGGHMWTCQICATTRGCSELSLFYRHGSWWRLVEAAEAHETAPFPPPARRRHGVATRGASATPSRPAANCLSRRGHAVERLTAHGLFF